MLHKLAPLQLTLQQASSWVRLGSFILALVILWLPQVAIILLATGWQWGDTPSNTQNLIGAVFLYLTLLTVLNSFSHWIDGKPFSQYGLRADRLDWLSLAAGLTLAVIGMLLLFEFEAQLGWVALRGTAIQTSAWPQVVLVGFASAFGLTLIEELLFRGFFINLWAKDYGWTGAITISAVIFAMAHFIKPPAAILASWPQFPGLILMGLLLGWSRVWLRDRLGLSLGLHWGWVWCIIVINTIGLVKYTGTIDPIWTGLNGNPLAGIVGLFFLGMTALAVWLITKILLVSHELR